MKNKEIHRETHRSKDLRERGVRETLLMGVFWRILIIEVVLLIGTLLYEAFSKDAGISHLLWYALRILGMVAVIILFMMVTLQSFLRKKIIAPLESIAAANEDFRQKGYGAVELALPEETPREIKGIVSTRMQMLETILRVSKERLQLADFIRDTFGRYLSKKVVDEIIENPSGRKIGGRRETVTVLMSDLRGFTGMSETMDAEEVVRVLNRYLGRMSEIILEYDGTIDEFMGDGILAAFGVPEKQADDAARAVACALSMQKALPELNEEMVAQGYPGLEMGIAINSGKVIVGNIGSRVRMKYGIVGAVVNRTARIESNAVGGDVLIGEATYGLVREIVKNDVPRSVMMKGLKSPLVYYRISAIGEPYNVSIDHGTSGGKGVEIHLPFHFWKVDGKTVLDEPSVGETRMFHDKLITARIDPNPEPMTDVKLKFDFCTEAHCFEDVYAKVMSVKETNHEPGAVDLRITSMNQKDREVINRWITEGSS